MQPNFIFMLTNTMKLMCHNTSRNVSQYNFPINTHRHSYLEKNGHKVSGIYKN
jgi:hypothetical protein